MEALSCEVKEQHFSDFSKQYKQQCTVFKHFILLKCYYYWIASLSSLKMICTYELILMNRALKRG